MDGDNRQRENNENSGRRVGEKGKGRDDSSVKTSSKVVSGDFLSFRERWYLAGIQGCNFLKYFIKQGAVESGYGEGFFI